MEKNYKLITPIEIEGQEPIVELTITEPNLNQLEKLDKVKGKIEMIKVVIGICAGLNPGQTGRIKARDVKGLESLLSDFL